MAMLTTIFSVPKIRVAGPGISLGLPCSEIAAN
jgi:hypothetical protein